jgi:hypothetical protein
LALLERRAGVLLGLLVLMVIAAIVILWQLGSSGPDQATTPTGEITVSEPAEGPAASGAPTTRVSVSGPWRVYTDEGKATALLELAFEPEGSAAFVMPHEGSGRLSVESWSYAQAPDAVEVTLLLRMVDPAYDVDYTMDAWLHLRQRGDGTLGGAFEQHVIGYETVGEHAGELHDAGRQTVLESVVAEPAS